MNKDDYIKKEIEHLEQILENKGLDKNRKKAIKARIKKLKKEVK